MKKEKKDQRKANISEKIHRAGKRPAEVPTENGRIAHHEKKVKKPLDKVDQASWESFPASDPPGW